MADKLIAFADESVRVSAVSPMYLIAATTIPENTSLAQLEEILPKGASKLHWRDLDFADPAIEHRLWVPDQILGAYSDTAMGLRSSTVWQQEWDALKENITTIEAKL